MQNVLSVVILGIILIGLPLLLLGDTDTSTAHADIPSKEASGSMSKASDSSALAATTTTMYAVDDE